MGSLLKTSKGNNWAGLVELVERHSCRMEYNRHIKDSQPGAKTFNALECLPLDSGQCCTAYFNFVEVLQVVRLLNQTQTYSNYETFTLLLSISCDVLIDVSLATKATCYVVLLYHNPMSIFAKNELENFLQDLQAET